MFQDVRNIFLQFSRGSKKMAGAGMAAHKPGASLRQGPKAKAPQTEHSLRNASRTSSCLRIGREAEIAAIEELFATPELVLPHLLTGAKVQR